MPLRVKSSVDCERRREPVGGRGSAEGRRRRNRGVPDPSGRAAPFPSRAPVRAAEGTGGADDQVRPVLGAPGMLADRPLGRSPVPAREAGHRIRGRGAVQGGLHEDRRGNGQPAQTVQVAARLRRRIRKASRNRRTAASAAGRIASGRWSHDPMRIPAIWNASSGKSGRFMHPLYTIPWKSSC
jgi:hypothetical protein